MMSAVGVARTPRRALVVALTGGVLALSGCSAVDAGQAAVSDDFRISQATVDAQTSEVADGLGEPPSQPPAGLAAAITQRLVQNALVEARAEQAGLTLTATQVEQGMAELTKSQGGHDQLVQAALQAGIPESALTAVVRTNLFVDMLSKAATGQTGGADVQSQIADLSAALNVEVAPRYGTWDDATLSIVRGSPVVKSGSDEAVAGQ